MKRVLLTGIRGTVAKAMKQELSGTYEVCGISLVRMDEVVRQIDQLETPTWKAQLEAYRARLLEQLTAALRGQDAVVHLGWNTRDDNCAAGLDPLNILQVDCVYRAAIDERVPRIYMASSVHAYEFDRVIEEDAEPIPPFPDTRDDPFGHPPSSLYGVSKRWMEIAGQFYVPRLHPGQKILVVRLGAVNPNGGRPGRSLRRLWNSYRDCAGLLAAFIECGDDAPPFWTAFGVSDNRSQAFPRPVFDTVNPYGFVPQDNEANEE